MFKELPEVINSFSYDSQTTVQSLIKDMKLDKSDLSSLVSKMASMRINTSYSPSAFDQFSSLNREFFIDMFRDADVRMRVFYSNANTIGLVLNSMVDVISSEIEKVEKDLNLMNTFINNYEFLSGKDDLYNSNYIENFDNSISDYRFDGYTFSLTDRDNILFDENGNGFVDQKSGSFKIGKNINSRNVLDFIDDIKIVTNYSNYITTDTGFYAALNESKSDSWNVTVKSPVILNSKLQETNKFISYDQSYISGAQALVEMNFAFPQEVDCIYITPGHGNGLQLLQVVLISDKANQNEFISFNENYLEQNDLQFMGDIELSSSNVTPILSQPKFIDSITDISFARTSISKIILIFNQPIYSKNEKTVSSTELTGKALYEIARQIKNNKSSSTDIIQDNVYNLFLKNNSIREIFKNNYFNESYYFFKYPYIKENFLSKDYRKAYIKESVEFDSLNTRWSTMITNVFQNFFIHSINDHNELFENSTYVESNSDLRSVYSFRSPGLIPEKNSNSFGHNRLQFIDAETVARSNDSTIKDLLALEKIDQYEYSFSIKSIIFGLTEQDRSNKSCFVSKKVETNGYPLGVKILMNKGKNNIDLNNYSFDLKDSVAYELSISNTEIPSSENDWIPILPVGQDNISSEVLFFDKVTRSATTRFYAIKETISIYKNGILMDTSQFILRENQIILNTYDESCVYSCSYRTDLKLYNYDNIDFIKSNLFKESTKSYFDTSGQGERFTSTDYLGKVTLKNMPYINTEFISTAKYNPYFGTVFSSDYQNYSPVKVLLSDGSYALNLTNYTTSRDLPAFPYSSGYYFVQNGKDIVFNQIVTEPFSVIYEYITGSLRFRAILRKTMPDVQYTGSLDSVLLKIKTKNYDPYYDKLNKALSKR